MTDATFVVPDDFDPKELLSATFSRFTLAKPQKVSLLFDSEIAPWVLERQWQPKQQIRQRRSGVIELSFEAAGLLEVFRWVMAWGHHCTVLAPEELKDWVVEEARMMVAKNNTP